MEPRRGFTLLETLVYVALMAMALTALSLIYAGSLQTNELVSAREAILDARRFAEPQIRERLREASTVTTPASGTANQLVFDAPVAAESPTTITLSGTTLMMQLGSTPAFALTPPDVQVTAFQATRLSGSPASVRVSITYASDTTKAMLVQSSVWTVTLRYE